MIQVQVLVIPEPIFARQARTRVRAHFTEFLVVCDSCCNHLIARALVGGREQVLLLPSKQRWPDRGRDRALDIRRVERRSPTGLCLRGMPSSHKVRVRCGDGPVHKRDKGLLCCGLRVE